jgi:hypothetical protein
LQTCRSSTQTLIRTAIGAYKQLTDLGSIQRAADGSEYLKMHPDGYSCYFVRPNWVLPRRAAA